MRILLFLMVLTTFWSCKKEEVAVFSVKDGVTFYANQYENLHADNFVNFSFANAITVQSRDTIYVRMRASGEIVDYPRTVQLKASEVGTTARAGIDYELPSSAIVPAGAYRFVYPVILINSPGMLTNTYRLVLEPVETKDFVVGVVGTTPPRSISLTDYPETNFISIKIDITNQLVQPAGWQPSIFGTFSIAKYRFMIQTTGLTDFSIEALGTDGLFNLPVKLRNALAVYEAANGPLIDENGNRVTF